MDSQESALLRLAAELRNRIYRYTLISDLPIDMSTTTATSAAALLATCHQIRREARSMYYTENTFIAKAYGMRSDCIKRWLDNVGPTHCAMMPKLEIHHVSTCATDGSLKSCDRNYDNAGYSLVTVVLRAGVRLDAVVIVASSQEDTFEELLTAAWRSGALDNISLCRKIQNVHLREIKARSSTAQQKSGNLP